MKKLLATLGLATSLFTISHSAHAATGYTIKSGDSLYKISQEFHVSITDLKKANHLSGDLIRTGDQLQIPAGVTSSLQKKSLSHSTTQQSGLTPSTGALTHSVQTGDTLWKIALKTGTPIAAIQTANHLASNIIKPGEPLTLPQRFNPAEKQMLAQLVTAEAKGEPYAGQVAVATVILNRIDSSLFPNTLKGVIYQKTGTHYAFTPVKTGSFNKPAQASAVKAVNEAIAMHHSYKKRGSLYYYNRKLVKTPWILSRPVVITIGHQTFAR